MSKINPHSIKSETAKYSFVVLNKYYSKYFEIWKINPESVKLDKLKLRILTILEILEGSIDKYALIITISNRHNDVFFEQCFCNYDTLVEYTNKTQEEEIKKVLYSNSDPQSKKGSYTSFGYISRIRLKDFVDRWFTKIKY